GIVMRAGRAYDGCLQKHRLLCTTASGAILGLAGDACTQAATDPAGSGFDARRCASFALFGGAVTGPINYVWLQRMSQAVVWL
ncbi:unnamed protein product, partial [Polarella glacialis]